MALSSCSAVCAWDVGAPQVSLHDYYILMPEAVSALEERERCLDQIHALEEELAATQATLSRGTGAKVGMELGNLRLALP